MSEYDTCHPGCLCRFCVQEAEEQAEAAELKEQERWEALTPQERAQEESRRKAGAAQLNRHDDEFTPAASTGSDF